MASIVSALGTSGSNGKALSRATRVSIRRTASETVSPIAASTVAASSFTAPSIRVCTRAFAAMSISFLHDDVMQANAKCNQAKPRLSTWRPGFAFFTFNAVSAIGSGP
jgi:hypothetical protein